MKHDQIEPPENLDQLDKHETAIESAANDLDEELAETRALYR